MVTTTRHINSPGSYSLELSGRGTLQDKFYVGFVKVADDVLRMGRLKVWIPELSGDPNDEAGWFIVSYCSPFAGATNVYDNTNENTYEGTQKSYGMWFIPPDINNEVVCAFINGDPGRGIWLGCLYQQNMNHMVPGIPGQDSTASPPVSEYNKKINQSDPNAPARPPYTPLVDGLLRQGLNEDTVRGVSDSGARRSEPANSVYGILTPGGNQMVFDDSPSNSYIRLRTQSGAQIMINDTSGFIYLNSVDGRNWISMDATGKIDIYAQDDISIRSQGSLNIRGDLDVNIEAGRDINMRARGRQLGASLQANPNSVQIPNLPPAGNIAVVGDSIAVGTGQRIQGATVAATVGDNSTTILRKVREDTTIKNFVNAILSVGSNDIVRGQGNTQLLANNLRDIRAALAAQNYVWLLPYDSVAKSTVKSFADGQGDKTLDLSNYPTSDNLHPRDYALVANDARTLCIPAPSTASSAAGATGAAAAPASGVGQTPYGTYNVGTYRTLPEAEAAAARYRSAADFARARPDLYPGEEGRTVFRFEAAANAEVARLRGQGATTPQSIQQSQPGPQGPTAAGAAYPAPTGPSQTGFSAGTTGPTGSVPTWQSIAIPFIKLEEAGNRPPPLRAYPDPPGRTNSYSIGYGHLIRNDIQAGRTSINCGPAGSAPIVGEAGRDTVMTREQVEGCFSIDVENLGGAPARRQLGGAWDLLGPYQQAALASYVYNTGNLREPIAKGLTNFIAQRDVENAAKTIETSVLTWRGGPPNALANRRKKEADLFRGRTDLIGQAGAPQTVDGYTRTSADSRASADGAPTSPPDTNVQGGYVKIQSKNNMHLLSDQHVFISSGRDMHRLAGGNMFDTAVGNVNRVAGGYMHENVRAGYSVGSSRGIVMNSPRIDLNGPVPTAAISASQAIGPISQRQTDAVVNSLGNVVVVQTETILPHLPYHEPYDNHGGRNFETIRDATQLDTNTGLRDGEIIRNSNEPLDVYGTPRSDMPPAVYRGMGYNSQNQPLYRFEASLSNTVILSSNALVISDSGKQFIKSRENGSYRTITSGNPPKQEIGYGHTLSPEEIGSRSIIIKGLSVNLNQPLTQQQINDLFDEDIEKVQTWMRPEIKAGLSQTQYDMFCSLAFNIGENNFKQSPVLSNFNDGNLQKVPNSWMQHTKNGAGQVVPGLVVRRRAEVVKFMQGPAIDNLNESQGVSNSAVDATEF